MSEQRQRTVRFFVPKVDLSLFGRNEVFAAWFLHSLFRQRVARKVGSEGWVSLKSGYLKQVMPWRAYRGIINVLIDKNIIECDESYLPGDRSKSFRLGHPYRDAEHRLVSYEVKGRTAQKLCKPIRKTPKDLPYLDTLRGYLARLKVRPEAEEYLATVPPGVRAEYCLPLLLLECPEVGLDDFGRRLHSPLTQMKKELRSYLTFDGWPVVEIDISNSQPLLLALLRLMSERCGNKYRLSADAPVVLLQETSSPPPAPYVVTFRPEGVREVTEREVGKVEGLEDDWTEFLSLCMSGSLYQAIGRVTGIDRRRAKKRTMRLLFEKRGRRWKFRRRLEERFPNVLRFLDWLKEHHYKAASRHLQRVESGLVIHNFARRYIELHPGDPIATIHDSILVPTAHQKRAVDLLQSCARAEYGVSLPLKVKLLTPAALPSPPPRKPKEETVPQATAA